MHACRPSTRPTPAISVDTSATNQPHADGHAGFCWVLPRPRFQVFSGSPSAFAVLTSLLTVACLLSQAPLVRAYRAAYRLLRTSATPAGCLVTALVTARLGNRPPHAKEGRDGLACTHIFRKEICQKSGFLFVCKTACWQPSASAACYEFALLLLNPSAQQRSKQKPTFNTAPRQPNRPRPGSLGNQATRCAIPCFLGKPFGNLLSWKPTVCCYSGCYVQALQPLAAPTLHPDRHAQRLAQRRHRTALPSADCGAALQ